MLPTKQSEFLFSGLSKLQSLDIRRLQRVLSVKAPILTSILHGAVACSSKSANISIVMAASILLKARNKNLCLLQSLVGQILYAGHASKMVSLSVTIQSRIHFLYVNVICCLVGIQTSSELLR